MINIERPITIERRPYLRLHPTDTDHHTSQKILFIDEKNRIIGPAITNGDTVDVSFQELETYEFDRADGEVLKFMISYIRGTIGFTHKYNLNGEPVKSAPMFVDFTDGYFMAIDPKTEEVKRHNFEDCLIAFRVREGDVVTVNPQSS